MADIARGLREDLAASIKEVEEPVEQEQAPVTDVAVEPAEGDAEPSAPSQRKRGPDGKFIAADADPAPAEAAPAAETAPAAPDAQPQPDPAPAATAGDPTARWNEADKTMFRTLPKPAQDFITRRYREMEGVVSKKTAEIADFRKTYEPVDQMFAPFKAQMRQQGWTEATLIKAWADVEQSLMSGKGADVVARLVRDYKIDPQAIARAINLPTPVPSGAAAAAPATTDAAPTFTPEVRALLQAEFGQVLTPLQKQLKALSDEADARQQHTLNEQTRAANQTVQNFIGEKLPSGEPAHPFYSEVETLMVTLAQAEKAAGRVPDLKTLYDQAVFAIPSTRQKVLSAQADLARKAADAEARTKAANARKAASSVTGAPGSGQSPKANSAEPKTLRQQLLEAQEEHDAA